MNLNHKIQININRRDVRVGSGLTADDGEFTRDYAGDTRVGVQAINHALAIISCIEGKEQAYADTVDMLMSALRWLQFGDVALSGTVKKIIHVGGCARRSYVSIESSAVDSKLTGVVAGAAATSGQKPVWYDTNERLPEDTEVCHWETCYEIKSAFVMGMSSIGTIELWQRVFVEETGFFNTDVPNPNVGKWHWLFCNNHQNVYEFTQPAFWLPLPARPYMESVDGKAVADAERNSILRNYDPALLSSSIALLSAVAVGEDVGQVKTAVKLLNQTGIFTLGELLSTTINRLRDVHMLSHSLITIVVKYLLCFGMSLLD